MQHQYIQHLVNQFGAAHNHISSTPVCKIHRKKRVKPEGRGTHTTAPITKGKDRNRLRPNILEPSKSRYNFARVVCRFFRIQFLCFRVSSVTRPGKFWSEPITETRKKSPFKRCSPRTHVQGCPAHDRFKGAVY